MHLIVRPLRYSTRHVRSQLLVFVAACGLSMLLALPSQAQSVDRTEQALRAQVADIERRFGPDSQATFNALVALGAHLEKSGRAAEALVVAERLQSLFEQALGAGNPEPGRLRNEMAQKYFILGRFSDAERHLKISVEILERTLPAEHPDIASAHSNLGLAQTRLGRFMEAEPHYRRALQILKAQPVPDFDALANTEDNLAQLFHALSRSADALRSAEQSLEWTLRLAEPQPASLSRRYNNLALAYNAVGRYAEALQAKERGVAIDLQRLGPRHPDYAKALNDLAIHQIATNNVSNAHATIQSARAVLGNSLAVSAEQATLLNTEAQARAELGDHSGALELLKRALAQREASSAPTRDIARTMANMGSMQVQLGDIDTGLASFERSLRLMQTQSPVDELDVAGVQHNLAATHAKATRFSEAASFSSASLRIRNRTLGPDHPDTLTSKLMSGFLGVLAGDFANAMPSLQSVLVALETSDAPHLRIAYAQGALSLAHAIQQQPDAAIVWGKQAVNTMQRVRQGAESLDLALQASFAEKHRELYHTLADLLIAQGRIAEAQQVLQMLKEHEFHDSVRGSGTDARGTRSTLTAIEATRMARYDELRKRKDAAAMKAFLAGLPADLAGAQQQSPGQSGLQITQTRLAQAVEHLAREEPAAHAVGLQYIITDNRLSILITSAGTPVVARQVPVGRKELNGIVSQFVAQLGHPDVNPAYLRTNARKLHAWLIAPISNDLVALRAETLMLSLTDALRLVPFAALHDGERYVLQKYTLAWFNEAGTPALVASPVDRWRVAAMGLSQPVGNMAALRGVPDELNAVVSSIGGNQYLNGAFRRDSLQTSLSSNYNVLHLASHYVHNPARPETSSLYLGDKTQLMLGDILRDNLRFDRFELVAFSACSTAVAASSGGIDGREMESLGTTAQIQGARAVLATLWQVSDTSTSQLMQAFYRERSRARSISKAQALREAQLAMLEGRLRPASNKNDDAWKEPYHWAPFVLMGNWR